MRYRNNRIDEGMFDDFVTSTKKILDVPIVRDIVKFFADEDDESEEEAPDSEDAVRAKEAKREMKDEIGDMSLEQIPLVDALRLTKKKRALIVGSSQAGVMGPAVMRALEAAQDFDFDFGAASNKSMRFVYTAVATNVRNRDIYDVVIIFPGYKLGETPESVVKLVELFTPARCFVVLPPPVTRVSDTFFAAETGVNRGNPVPEDFWFILRNGKYSQEREEYCRSLKSAVISAGATPVDPRDHVRGGELQQSGVSFPPSRDGIHPGDDVSSRIAEGVVDAITTCDLPVPVDEVLKKVSLEDLQRDPGAADSLKSAPATKKFIGRISSGFGRRKDPFTGRSKGHQGLDISVPIGTPVKAALSGVVKSTVYGTPRAGNYVEIRHQNGDITRYLHLSKINVQKGETVTTGQVIAMSGNTGRSTGPHLHWETWGPGGFNKGALFNPNEWLKMNTGATKPVEY
jgi:murein DD-endopeptidase MepM/ murein hydrolase activator NlpD